jgi:hypothetical protein
VPAHEHDDAALDDVEPGSLLLEGLAEAPLPPLAYDKLHLAALIVFLVPGLEQEKRIVATG